ncbi:MAG: helix-turn-helix transcriptional regulator [Acidimicrobiales bacterium]|mgnify:FL=1|jgi:molybdopterin-binding protein|uniref:Mop domain-containing protein n=1 Tax=marine metagenome TaxID=408172 RepID=A0A382G016_9ZZZZ|nr:MerR family transcriptional regulator [Acidimicrobiaceae bacterium]MDG2352263.1 helix-turn-helix transcriptional regulator [Acidimicrobiales bacterium]MBT68873.1 MerR family transcriptional regulator [Acidimicrobiaceae bacterium]MDP6161518.1 helix-turn-helix transcriptional regulator [Acidimicrobiales bacterium]MDP6285287.1 helix-turn-helix transcriptional regulator [Acidimicrobiales bacterium]|tara:strand:- start:23171 stop:23560 length:390 start_codon:yes stop_codon:yes gene_type:complete
MYKFRIGEAAQLLGVSADTVRRWADSGRLSIERTEGGHRLINGVELAKLAQEISNSSEQEGATLSARNRFTGLITRVVADGVMAQVELQAGPYRVVSLISAEAVKELGLKPGALAVAAIKATNVVIESP